MKSRFAPSPSGYLHIGSARTALFAWLFAKQQKGEFVLRIEDTDASRSSQESVDAILESLAWLGLDYDQGPIYQSQRFDRYRAIIQQLLNENKAYYCTCSQQRLDNLRNDLKVQGKKPKYDGNCRDKNHKSGVVRFKNPLDGTVIWTDLVKGDIRIDNQQLDDLIIARGDNTPTYNLTVVVDDYDYQIDVVIRGDDHISNTPKQINLYQALAWKLPQFAHLPMILSDDGSRLSKRNGDVGVLWYRQKGFLAEALLNYLVRLGWSHGNDEVFSIEQMTQLFNFKNINKAPAAFNQDKLLWLNQTHIKNSSIDNLARQLDWHLQNQAIKIIDNPKIEAVIAHLQTRCKTLLEMANEMKLFYQDFDTFDEKLAQLHFTDKAPIVLLLSKLEDLSNWQADDISATVKEVCAELNIGFAKVGNPFRLALSSNGKAGGVGIVAELVGREKTLKRLKMAIDFC